MSGKYLDCPIPWCQGFRDEHGGDWDPDDPRTPEQRGYPADPSLWEHRAAEETLPGVGWGAFAATGAGQLRYQVGREDFLRPDPSDPKGLRDLANKLDQSAQILRSRADELERRAQAR